MGNKYTVVAEPDTEPRRSVVFVRHSLSENNFIGTFSVLPRHKNAPLTLVGREQAQATAKVIETFINTTTVFTSDMDRAVESGIFHSCVDHPKTIIPTPFLAELGSSKKRFIKTVNELENHFSDLLSVRCAKIEKGIFEDALWASSKTCCGDFKVSFLKFQTLIFPKICEMVKGDIVVVGHGRYMRYMLNTFTRFNNSQIVFLEMGAITGKLYRYFTPTEKRQKCSTVTSEVCDPLLGSHVYNKFINDDSEFTYTKLKSI